MVLIRSNKRMAFLFSSLLLVGCTVQFEEKTDIELTEKEQYSDFGSKNSTDLQDSWRSDEFLIEKTYLREYSAEHLISNPKQIVNKIVVSFWYIPTKAKSARNFFGFDGNQDKAIVDIYIQYKNSPKWYMQNGQCTKSLKNDFYECFVDGDAGQFSIEFDKDKLILKGGIRMEMCGIVWEEVGEQISGSTSGLSSEDYKGEESFFLYETLKIPFEVNEEIVKCFYYYYQS